jgi:hypothetical protein
MRLRKQGGWTLHPMHRRGAYQSVADELEVVEAIYG